MRHANGTLSDLTLALNEAIVELSAPITPADGTLASATSQMNALFAWAGYSFVADGTLSGDTTTYNLFVDAMPIIIKRLARFSGGLVVFEYEYDYENLYLTTLRCINNSSYAAWAKATVLKNGRTYDQVFPANQTTTINLPTATSKRLEIYINPANGKVDGVDYRIMYPYY